VTYSPPTGVGSLGQGHKRRRRSPPVDGQTWGLFAKHHYAWEEGKGAGPTCRRGRMVLPAEPRRAEPPAGNVALAVFLQGYRLRFGFFYPIQYQSSQYQHANDETKLKHVVACAAVGSLDSCTPAVPLLEATTATASLRELHRTTARTGMHGSACLTCHASSDASLNSKSVGHKVRGTQNQTR
jgi:hypothetical protein